MKALPQQEPSTQAKVVTVTYDDLVSFDSQNPNALLLEQIGSTAFGPQGLGLVQVSGVPNMCQLRRALLPLAAQLAAVPDLESTCVDPDSFFSVGWSHGREVLAATGQPDTNKGSFYANPLTENLLVALTKRDGPCPRRDATAARHPEFFAPNIWPEQQLPELATAFCDMGKLLHSVGCRIAEVCDAYCYRCHGVETSIASCLRRSLNAKGRLLHYFPPPAEEPGRCTRRSLEIHPDAQEEKPWCAWHNDHGSLTGLVPGMFLTNNSWNNNVVSSGVESGDHTTGGGLYVQARNGKCVHVTIPDDHCAFQIGETSQIMSGGILQATPHAVLPPTSSLSSSISRESFALFLEPEFDDPLTIPPGFTVEDCQGSSDQEESLGLRPLKDRWKPGQTFGDFHLATVSAFATFHS